jgi:hypothetical protein
MNKKKSTHKKKINKGSCSHTQEFQRSIISFGCQKLVVGSGKT